MHGIEVSLKQKRKCVQDIEQPNGIGKLQALMHMQQ